MNLFCDRTLKLPISWCHMVTMAALRGLYRRQVHFGAANQISVSDTHWADELVILIYWVHVFIEIDMMVEVC